MKKKKDEVSDGGGSRAVARSLSASKSSIVAGLVAVGAGQKASERLMAAMDATRQEGSPKSGYCEVPDWHAQIKAAELVLAYIEGLPIKRQEIITGQMDSAETLERAAEKSPALVARLEGLVERLRGKSDKSRPKNPPRGKPPAIDLDAEI